MKRALCLILLCGLCGPHLAAADDLIVKKQVDGVDYHILKVKPEQVKILWKDDEGNPLRTFPAAAAYLEKKGTPAQVMCNGGIFEPGGVPSGLLVQEGKQLKPINLDKGEGNFFLKPNGVFLVGLHGAIVMDSSQYPPQGIPVAYAVQSGPLLLVNGKIHPKFNPNSQWRLHRNGVGVNDAGDVVFAMTDFRSPKFPTLHEFAKLFAAEGCRNALFLDGDLSQMKSGEDLKKRSNRFGSIIAVVANPEKKP